LQDTIAAIATGQTISAIGIIRISGPNAITAADNLFYAKNGQTLKTAENRKMYYGELKGEDGTLIDLCLCTISRAPDSYTGENTVELQCHGSPIVMAETLRALFKHGVRQAQAGEFTKRAFLNGRIDLTQAEAIIDLIEAETITAAKNAAGQLHGAISKKLDAQYQSLLDIMAHFHAVIDYPDEDIDEFEMQSYKKTLQSVEEELKLMLSTHESGRIMREGIPTAIVGRPNTGKSSLLNALMGYERAIVTEIPGTTRDTIEEKILIGEKMLRLVDTAGLRKTDDTVEKLGVSRTKEAIQRAKLILLVLDGSEELHDDDIEVLETIPPEKKKLAIVNKSDLIPKLKTTALEKWDIDICSISALTGEGLDTLITKLQKLIPDSNTKPLGEIITNMRQAEAIARAKESIQQTITAIDEMITPDAVLTEVEAALAAIGEIIGKTMREDIVARIFERFCVGK